MASPGDTLTNKAGVTYTDSTGSVSDSAVSTFEVTASTVTFEKSQNPTTGPVGTIVTFTLTLKTDDKITDVVIVDGLASAGYAFVSGSVSIDGVSSPSDDPQVGINLGTLAGGTSITVTFDGVVQ